LERKMFDVRCLVKEAIDLVSSQAAAARRRVEYVSPAEPIRAALDADQFRQVLLNLLRNSFDATGDDGVIRVELESQSIGSLTLRVIDNGCGLPAELGQRIFDPFVTAKGAGLGLGLSICRRIVESHGGEISAATRPEGGALFTVRLPMPKEE